MHRPGLPDTSPPSLVTDASLPLPWDSLCLDQVSPSCVFETLPLLLFWLQLSQNISIIPLLGFFIPLRSLPGVPNQIRMSHFIRRNIYLSPLWVLGCLLLFVASSNHRTTKLYFLTHILQLYPRGFETAQRQYPHVLLILFFVSYPPGIYSWRNYRYFLNFYLCVQTSYKTFALYILFV